MNELQFKIKKKIEGKIRKGEYIFEKVNCCICRGNNFEILSKKDRYGLYVPVVICKDCGLIQQNPRMRQEDYNNFYDTEQKKLYLGKNRTTIGYFNKQYTKGENIFKYIQRNLDKKIKNKKILEIGASAGGILKYFKEKGNEVYGCDLNFEYTKYGREKYELNLIHGTVDDVIDRFDNTFDIVIMSHVLEHILNPISDLVKIKNILHKNSYIYIEIPGVNYLTNSYDMDFLKQIQNAHIYYFTLTTLNNLLNKAGYELVSGNEVIQSIFKISQNKKKYSIYKNDYAQSIKFLKKMEFLRFFPTRYNLKRTIFPLLIKVLKYSGTYNLLRKKYHTWRK